MDLIFLIYGAAFFFLGAAILLQPKRSSSFELAHILWLLAFFGLIHGANEWLDMWKLQHESGDVLAVVNIVFLIVSYVFLFEFGRRLVLLSLLASDKKSVFSLLLSWPVYLILLGGVFAAALLAEEPMPAMNIWARYLLGFSGSVLTGVGFISYFRKNVYQLIVLDLRRYFYLAAFAFIAYGISSGMIVPAAGYFPANIINYDNFMDATQLPVQLFRAMAAVLAAIAVIRILGIFRWEADFRLQAALTQTKHSLAEKEKLMYQYQLVLNTAGDGILEVNKSGVCTFANPAAKKIFGFDDDFVEAHLLDSLSCIDDKGESVANILMEDVLYTINNEVSRQKDDFTFVCKKDKPVSIAYIVTPVKQHDIVNQSVIIFHDTTESKQAIQKHQQLQMQLSQMQKMNALDNLTGGIAHDYNNMLGVILGYSDILKDALSGQPELFKYAHEIHHAGERGAELTRKLLAFSRQQASNTELLSINALLLDQQYMLETTLTSRIKLVLNLANDLWPVLIDGGGLEDVILNLSINAMHAIDATGQLTIQTTNERVDKMEADNLQLSEGDYVVLNIVDTGCGMNEETKARIFEPFFSTKGELGTGLGLSQTYGFVKQSGGIINVYSESGCGTRFVLHFPRHHESVGDDKSEEDTVVDLRGNETILVVDDEPVLLKLNSQRLQAQGYRVVCAENAKQALDTLEHETIDLLFSDVVMPDMDGYELAAIVRDKYPAVKIQLASGFEGGRDVETMDENLHKNLLHKPISVQVLIQRIRKLLDE